MASVAQCCNDGGIHFNGVTSRLTCAVYIYFYVLGLVTNFTEYTAGTSHWQTIEQKMWVTGHICVSES